MVTPMPRVLLADLARRGFTVRAVGGSVSVIPASRLTEDDRRVIREGRAELLVCLTPVEPWDRAEANRLMLEADGLVGQLGLDGSVPPIMDAAAAVVAASGTRDMETLRFAVAEFTTLVRRLAAAGGPVRGGG